MMKRLLLCLLLALPLSAKEKLRVLMIGNSYTAQTHQMLKGFLEADGEVDPEMVVHSPGGAFLHQHAANPKVAKLLEREWDVVVVQEQSQLPAFAMNGDEGAEKRFLEGGEALIEQVRQGPGEPRILLFQTWARHADDGKRGTLDHFGGKPERMQDALAKGYALLAKKAGRGVEVVEVGRAFERWYRDKGYEDSKLSLHRGDGSHPSRLGAYLTGAVFYRAITGKDASATGHRGDLEPAGVADDLLKVAGTSERR